MFRTGFLAFSFGVLGLRVRGREFWGLEFASLGLRAKGGSGVSFCESNCWDEVSF